MISECDEVYLFSPLGKLFHLPQDNTAMGLGKVDDVGYEDVPIAGSKERHVKLVSTSRPSVGNVLHNHSMKTTSRYGPRVAHDAGIDAVNYAKIEEMPMLFYSYDDLALTNVPYEQQRAIEFPHVIEDSNDPEDIRVREFMMNAFSVPIEMRFVPGVSNPSEK